MRRSNLFAIRLSSGQLIQLQEGVKLHAQDVLGFQTRAGGGAFAEIVHNPNDPTVLGLKNLSGQAWSASMPDGGQRRVEPGRSLKLELGTRVTFGSLIGDIHERQGRFSLGLPAGQTISLNEGVQLTAGDLLGAGGATSGGPATAEVVYNPNDPTVLGLKNLSGQGWLATVPDGSQRRVEPGRSLKLAAKTTIHFGSLEGEVQGSGTPTVQRSPVGIGTRLRHLSKPAIGIVLFLLVLGSALLWLRTTNFGRTSSDASQSDLPPLNGSDLGGDTHDLDDLDL